MGPQQETPGPPTRHRLRDIQPKKVNDKFSKEIELTLELIELHAALLFVTKAHCEFL